MKFHKLAIACGLATSLALPAGIVGAQEGLEEIVVTGRKVEETLLDVPVAITVWTASALEDAGIFDTQDLFDATPGLTLDTVNGDRNSSNPGIRGVQASEVNTVLQKVNSFIDGTPILGQANSISFNGVDQIEVYRGPQSAAFGRSTFAGALNYITSDATEEFEGTITGKVSDLGGNEVGVRLSGPINDNLGYRISYVADEFEGPDEWRANDGTQLGERGTDTLSGKLNFQISDTIYGEVVYNRLDQEDGPAITYTLNPEECFGTSGIFQSAMMTTVELPAGGTFDCDIDDGFPVRNADPLTSFLDQFDENVAFYEASVGNIAPLDANGDGQLQAEEFLSQTLADGQTFEQAIIAQTADNTIVTERDRLHGSINFEFGDSLLTILGLYSEEFSQRFDENDLNDTIPVFVDMMGNFGLDGAVSAMSNPTDVEERYLEARWSSPNDRRLRYTLSASYYDYEAGTQIFNAPGVISNNLTLPDGTPLSANPGFQTSDITETFGGTFGLFYDLTERTTFTLEGRLQSDENCGESSQVPGSQLCITGTSFAPRIALNHSISDTSSAYAQISQGTNPGGVNAAYTDPGNIEALLIATGQIAVPDFAPDGTPIANAGIIFDGSVEGFDPAISQDASQLESYEEETLTNYEIGYRGTFAGGRGNFSGALFYADWEDQIIGDNLNWDDDLENGWNFGDWNDFTGERTFINAGDVELFGFEFETSYRINDIFNVNFNGNLLSSTFSDFCTTDAENFTFEDGSPVIPLVVQSDNEAAPNLCGVVDGNDVPRQADFRANLNVTANLPNDVLGFRTSIRADMRYTGSSYIDDLNLFEQPDATTFNLSATLRNDNLNLRFFVNNVTDEDTPQNINIGSIETQQEDPTLAPVNTGGFSVVPRRPREFGVSATYNF